MNEIKPTPGGQTIIGNSKESATLTADDIQIIKIKFNKKKKIVYYCMLIFFIAGALVSAYAIYDYGFSRFENFVPFIIGIVAVLICILVLVMFNQEQNIALTSGKIIYKGVVSQLSGKATRTGTGNNRQTDTNYYVHLGDEIRFESEDLYYDLNVGDTIDVAISERLNIILYKNIRKKKAVSDVMPEVIADYGIVQEIKSRHQVERRTELLSDEELSALKAQKQRRIKRILPIAVVFVLSLGISSEIILWSDDFYTWDQALAIRIGFWGSPLVFFGFLLWRRVLPLSKDIQSGQKNIFMDKLINKNQYTWASTGETDYYLVGLTGKTTVSIEFFNSINAGDSFELHKTTVREKLLMAVNPATGHKYLNPEIFKK